MRILITNDDGIHAEGLAALARAASSLGTVKLVAPDRERSACGHSMTMREPLRVREVSTREFEAYEVNGVPVDCVNVGLTVAWPDGCDLVLSGMNHGPNLGYDVTYSGTVAGAMEGAINQVPSISVSMAAFLSGQHLHFETGVRWLQEAWSMLLSLPQAPETFLNINIPAVPSEELRGHRFVPMAGRVYQDRVELRDDPWGKPYYWQGGVAVIDRHQPETDLAAVHERYVSITPLSLNWTDRNLLAAFESATSDNS